MPKESNFDYINKIYRMQLLTWHKPRSNVRSSSSQMFFKKDVLRNFGNFIENTCVGVSFFNIGKGLKTFNFIKKRFQQRCFPVKFAKSFKTLLHRAPPVAVSRMLFNSFKTNGPIIYTPITAQKIKFSIKVLVTHAKEILNRKLRLFAQ